MEFEKCANMSSFCRPGHLLLRHLISSIAKVMKLSAITTNSIAKVTNSSANGTNKGEHNLTAKVSLLRINTYLTFGWCKCLGN